LLPYLKLVRGSGGYQSASVRTVGLTRKFDGTIAVDNLDSTIASGAIFGLLGPHGAGKPTNSAVRLPLP